MNDENQSTICAWAQTTFGKPRKEKMVARMHAEVSELVDVALSGRRAKARREAMAKECADVLIVLYQVAQAYNIDLHSAVDDKMFINRQRSWVLTGGGTGQHVQAEAQP